MEPKILTDPAIQPTEELIASILGENNVYWQQIIHYLYDHHSYITEQWRFYNDAKCWLYRALRKKKTIFWVGILKDTFRIAFYLNDKAEELIEDSSLSESIKEEFRNAKRSTFGRSVTVVMRSAEDLENVLKLIEVKLKIK